MTFGLVLTIVKTDKTIGATFCKFSAVAREVPVLYVAARCQMGSSEEASQRQQDTLATSITNTAAAASEMKPAPN